MYTYSIYEQSGSKKGWLPPLLFKRREREIYRLGYPWFPVIFPWIFHPKPPFFLLKGTWVSSRQCPVPEPTSWWLILTPNKKITHQLGPSLLDQETNRWNHQNLIDPPNWMANFPLKIGQDPLVVHLWATFFSGKRQTWYTGILPWRWTNI